MPETSLATAVAAVAFAILLLLGPGGVMLRLVGFRGSFALALAPACSTAVLGSGAILAQLLGVRWGLPAAGGSIALGIALAAVIGRLTTGPIREESLPRGERAAVGLGLLLATVPTLAATGSVDAYLQRWDAVFHLSALRLIDESGSASSLTLGSLSYGDGRAAIYPAGWHALASLLPGSPTAVLTLGSTVTAALPWVLGCAVLARELSRWRARSAAPAAAGIAGVLAGLVTATPMSLWIGWGHVPNAAAVAMVPAALALTLRLLRVPTGRLVSVIVLLVALLGMGLCHPNAVLSWGALILPALVAAVVTRSRAEHAAGRRLRAVGIPVGVAVVVVAGVAVFLRSPLASAVTGYAGGQSQSLGSALLEVLMGQYRLWSSTTGAVVGLVALASAVVACTRGRWLGAATLGVAWVLYVDAATGAPLGLSPLWYSSSARLSVTVTVVVVPLAADGLARLAHLWHGQASRSRMASSGVGAAALLPIIGAILVVALAVPSVTMRTGRTAAVYDDEPGNPPQFVTAGEIAMIGELPDLLDGVVLGSPFSGASSAFGLVGLPVVFPVAGQVWSADQQLVMDNLSDVAAGTASAQVCDAVERLGIRYLYQDSEPYQVDNRYIALDTLEVAGAQVVAEADTARVLQLPECRG